MVEKNFFALEAWGKLVMARGIAPEVRSGMTQGVCGHIRDMPRVSHVAWSAPVRTRPGGIEAKSDL
jgi:hypothetical protein